MTTAKTESLVELMREGIVLPEGFTQPILFASDRRAKPHFVLRQAPSDPVVFRPMVTKWPYAHQEIRQARNWAGYTLPDEQVHPVAVRRGGDGELLAVMPLTSLMSALS